MRHAAKDRPADELEHKSFQITEIKALDEGDEPGVFEAIVATWDDIDSYNDRMVQGAFTETLKNDGFPPIIWSHDRYVPPIGAALEATETDKGLYIKGRLLVAEDEDHAIARQVYAAMKAKGGDGRAPLRQFSFGYRVKEARYVVEDDIEIRELVAVQLFEVSPTLVGANPATELLAVKTDTTGAPAPAPHGPSWGEAAQQLIDASRRRAPLI